MLSHALVMCKRPACRPSGLEHKIQALGRLGCWRRPKTEPLLRVVPSQN
jgi:hypothetical protein